jgi:hypothetical protein
MDTEQNTRELWNKIHIKERMKQIIYTDTVVSFVWYPVLENLQ